MKDDLKLIRQKIRAANKMPANNPTEYRLKDDILRHWKLEQHKLKYCMKEDIRFLEFLASEGSSRGGSETSLPTA